MCSRVTNNMLLTYVALVLTTLSTPTICMSLKNANSTILRTARGIKVDKLPMNVTFGNEALKSAVVRERTDVIFPGPFTSKYPRLKIPSLESAPPCADGATFCENIDSYPSQVLEEVLRRSQVDMKIFGADETVVEISNRNGGEEEQFICGAKEKVIFPKVGKTKSNKWRYIINQEDNKKYLQGVRIETCTSPGQPCDLIDAVPLGYVTSCKQKFVYRRLLTVQNNEPVKDYFEMPSACCCSYRKDLSFLSTFGAPMSPMGKKRR